jgi:23S rRNA (pseudouridine1915-N3)-methyltransferase
MKVKLIMIGKTDHTYINEGISEYANRLKHYLPMEMLVINAVKGRGLSINQIKQVEAEGLNKHIGKGDRVVLLDEKGKQFSSKEFAVFLQQQMNQAVQNLVFVVGGPYGFSEEFSSRFPQKMSLSKMTFSHQMVRLFFVEQLYRAMSILKNESYHHE